MLTPVRCTSRTVGMLFTARSRLVKSLYRHGPTERNIKALMAFESFTSSYAHGLRGTFDRVSSNPTSQKLQLPPAAWGPKRVESGETPTFV